MGLGRSRRRRATTAYYDPWGWTSRYPPAVAYGYDEDGALKLKVKPRERRGATSTATTPASWTTIDGVFQRLHLEPDRTGSKSALEGYEPLSSSPHPPDQTVTYKGELQKLRAVD